MKSFKSLSLIVALTASFSYGMELNVQDTFSHTHGIKWKKDNFGNIWPDVQNIDHDNLGTKLQNFVTELQEKEKGNAILINLPHEEGHKAVTLVKAGFKPHYTDTTKTEWVIKNGSPMPEVSTAAAGARVLVCHEDKVLVIEDKNMKGRIMYPGGSVNARELALDAACRELKEEVDLNTQPADLQKIALVNRVRGNRYGYSDYCHYYLTRTFTGQVKIDETEVTQAFWTPLSELAKGEPINNLKISPTVKLLAAHILSNGKTSSNRVLDPRQYLIAAAQQDSHDIMDVDLFGINN